MSDTVQNAKVAMSQRQTFSQIGVDQRDRTTKGNTEYGLDYGIEKGH